MLTESARRCAFPSLEGVAYFNTAAEGVPPASVVDALAQYAQDKLLGMDGRERHQILWQSAKGRVATAEAYRHLGLAPAGRDGTEQQHLL